MRIRSKLILLSIIFILGMFSMIGLAVRTWRQMEQVNSYIEQGVELQVKSRDVQSLMKDMVFDLFVPKLYGQLRSFTYSPRSIVTIRQWKESVYEYKDAFREFSQARESLGIEDPELLDQFDTAETMHEKAMIRLEQLDSLVTMIKGQLGQLDDDRRYNEILGEDTFIPFFEEFRDTSYYFVNSFESFMNYFLNEFRLYAVDIRNRIFIIFLVLAAAITILGILSSLLISRDFLWKIKHVEEVFRGVSRGDFSTKMHINSHDEFGYLSNQFNELTSDLKQNVDNILMLTRDLGNSISERTSLDELLNIVVRTIVNEQTADGAAVYLQGIVETPSGENELSLKSFIGYVGEYGEGPDELFRNAAEIVRQDRRLLIRTPEGVAAEGKSVLDSDHYSSLLAVPLHAEGQMIGVIVMVKRAGHAPFTDLGVTRLSTFGEYAGLLLDNHFKYLELIGKGEAEYLALQSQVQPHFIYNILNGFIGLNRLQARDELEQAIIQLKDMLRYTQDASGWTTLEEELHFVGNYCELQRMRFEDRLTYTLEYDERAAKTCIPRLILQPLVENAVIHGIEPAEGKSRLLQVRAFYTLESDDRLLTISVRDNGVGFDLDSLKEREHIGIGNVRKRLLYTFPHARFSVHSKPGEGTEVRISISVDAAEKKLTIER